jgi:hypothetical protein
VVSPPSSNAIFWTYPVGGIRSLEGRCISGLRTCPRGLARPTGPQHWTW